MIVSGKSIARKRDGESYRSGSPDPGPEMKTIRVPTHCAVSCRKLIVILPGQLAIAIADHKELSTRSTWDDDTYSFVSSNLHRGNISAPSNIGPLNLAVMFRFCRMLQSRLNCRGAKGIAYCVESNIHATANACLLLGSFLVWNRGFWAVDAAGLFATSDLPILRFRDASSSPSSCNLTLLDCLLGLEKASRLGWFGTESFDLQSYEALDHPTAGRVHHVCPKLVAFDCPAPTAALAAADRPTPAPPVEHFPALFRLLGVSCVVRVGPGAPCYDPSAFERAGIRFLDLGLPPPPAAADRFFDVCDAESRVAIHGGGPGGGRAAAALAAAWLVRRAGFAPAEAIAWVRTVRPERPGPGPGPIPFLQPARDPDTRPRPTPSAMCLSARAPPGPRGPASLRPIRTPRAAAGCSPASPRAAAGFDRGAAGRPRPIDSDGSCGLPFGAQAVSSSIGGGGGGGGGGGRGIWCGDKSWPGACLPPGPADGPADSLPLSRPASSRGARPAAAIRLRSGVVTQAAAAAAAAAAEAAEGARWSARGPGVLSEQGPQRAREPPPLPAPAPSAAWPAPVRPAPAPSSLTAAGPGGPGSPRLEAALPDLDWLDGGGRLRWPGRDGPKSRAGARRLLPPPPELDADSLPAGGTSRGGAAEAGDCVVACSAAGAGAEAGPAGAARPTMAGLLAGGGCRLRRASLVRAATTRAWAPRPARPEEDAGAGPTLSLPGI